MQTMEAPLRFLAIFALAGQDFLSHAILLRQRNTTAESSVAVLKTPKVVKSVNDSSLPSIPAAISLKRGQAPVKIHDDISYDVVNKSSIERTASMDCLCKIGSFWHWRIKSCVKQGGWGYECGFFPEEHHDKVCQDGLKCEVLEETKVKYFHPGARPASCTACKPEDNCLTGKERHSQSCLKEFKLAGEACQTVRVTVKATAEVKVSENVTKSSSAEAKATAQATEKATSTDGTASAEAKASAVGEAKATAEASSTAQAKAKATKAGVADGTACVTLAEVKEMLKLKNVPRIGAVLSSMVVSAGDAEAFDRAYKKALDAAKEAGIISATDAAKVLAQAEAREHAALDATAKANEAAAWKAEAGAKENAQAKAKAEALKQAQTAAQQEAAQAAKAAADAAARAEAAEKAAAQAAEAAKQSGDAKAKAAEQAAAQKAAAAAAAAQAEADAAKAAAAEAKARAEAVNDVVTPSNTPAPIRITTPEPTPLPRKITAEQIAAKLP